MKTRKNNKLKNNQNQLIMFLNKQMSMKMMKMKMMKKMKQK